MPTQRQIQANRLNALRSTGPRSVEGKAVSRLNALSSGIHSITEVIPGESSSQLSDLTDEYYRFYAPATPGERALLDILVHCEWLLRRLRRVESSILDGMPSDFREAYLANDQALARLQRRLDATARTYQRALKDLDRLQSTRCEDPEPEPATLPQPIELSAPCPTIGFVPPIAPPAATPAATPPAANQPPRSFPAFYPVSSEPRRL